MIEFRVRRDQVHHEGEYVTIVLDDDEVLEVIANTDRCLHSWQKVAETRREYTTLLECSECGKISKACMK